MLPLTPRTLELAFLTTCRAEARDKLAITSLRLHTVLTVRSKVRLRALSGTRLVLTTVSRTSPRHLARKASWITWRTVRDLNPRPLG